MDSYSKSPLPLAGGGRRAVRAADLQNRRTVSFSNKIIIHLTAHAICKMHVAQQTAPPPPHTHNERQPKSHMSPVCTHMDILRADACMAEFIYQKIISGVCKNTCSLLSLVLVSLLAILNVKFQIEDFVMQWKFRTNLEFRTDQNWPMGASIVVFLLTILQIQHRL